MMQIVREKREKQKAKEAKTLWRGVGGQTEKIHDLA